MNTLSFLLFSEENLSLLHWAKFASRLSLVALWP